MKKCYAILKLFGTTEKNTEIISLVLIKSRSTSVSIRLETLLEYLM